MEEELIDEEVQQLNSKYRSVLDSQEERILHTPILANKIKPKDFFGLFKEQKRYLMFTNRKLYTMEPKQYDAGEINKDKLVVNKIDVEYLSHLIFFPEFVFDSYEFLDVKRIASQNPNMVDEFKMKKCKVIIGFKPGGGHGF